MFICFGAEEGNTGILTSLLSCELWVNYSDKEEWVYFWHVIWQLASDMVGNNNISIPESYVVI